MDEIVRQAMTKWPNVPHCFGWLSLDARGAWRMRDERTQALGLPGDKIIHAALRSFINRNYAHDDRGRWYFQNGPQRVYVNLEATPYIAHTDSNQDFVLHTGQQLADIDATWMTDSGQLVLQSGEIVALVDDRDMTHAMSKLCMHGKPASDEQLMQWLTSHADAGDLTLSHHKKSLPVQRMARDALAQHFGFICSPQADPA